MEYDGLHLIVDSLAEKTTLAVLNLSQNLIMSKGLADIMRLLATTQLKNVGIADNEDVFPDKSAVKNFITVLRQHTSIEEFQSELKNTFEHKAEVMVINTTF
jgi:hypothetical protein